MSTQRERQNYAWRPNDTSSTTNLRYDLEAKHWLKAFKSAESSGGTGVSGNWGASFAVIGLIIHFIVVAIWFVLVIVVDLIVWIVNLFDSPKPYESKATKNDTIKVTPINDKELNKLWDKNIYVDIEEENSR